MKIKPAYMTEDGYVFECNNCNDFSKVLKVIGKSSSSSEVVNSLREKNIPFKLYREIEEVSIDAT